MNYTQKDYYTEITYKQYFYDNKLVEFDKNNLKILEDISDVFNLIKNDYINYVQINDILIIHECEYGWFVINYYPKFYRCNQFEGLIYCLKDIGIGVDYYRDKVIDLLIN